MSNIESNNPQNGGLEDYNNISEGIFPNFTIPSIKISLGQILSNFNAIWVFRSYLFSFQWL
jgi:hypothetical protein